jgi:HPt (histidine-containing phosphotransfer) domain-containing protein
VRQAARFADDCIDSRHMTKQAAPADPERKPARRLSAMLVCCIALGWAMHRLDEAGAPLAVLLLWVTFEFGRRFGGRDARLAIAMAGITFALVIATTPFWQRHWLLGASLLTMLAVPDYLQRSNRRNSAAPTSIIAAAPNEPHEPDIDEAVLTELAEASNNTEFLVNFVRSSLHDAGLAIASLEAAGEREDWDEFRDRAHAIRGITANIGASRVARLAGRAMHRDSLSLPSQWSADCRDLRRALEAAGPQMDELLDAICNR